MSYRDQRGFTDSQDNQKDFNEKYMDKDSGPYIATVKTTADPLRMGRLGVNIPALSLTTEPTSRQITWCQYLSPFYGVKSLRATSKTDPYSFKESQQAYGMWAVPPDVDTTVLVIFAKGDQNTTTAFWMGCVQDPLTNQMVPGYGSSERTVISARGVDESVGSTSQKQIFYGTDTLPTGEKNRNVAGDTISNAQLWKYPVNEQLADQLLEQGLVQDKVRGTTSSSARRESPSQVFGWNTPGRFSSGSKPKNIGLDNSPVRTDRDTGHSLVMDDGDVNGDNQLTRLRTASGHQILLHDTEGTVYIANGSGKAFLEMDKNGKISVYSDKGIDIRAEGDFNLHSDNNINFHAKEKINFTAEKNVVLNAEKYVYVMGDSGILGASQNGAIRNYAFEGITSYTPTNQHHGAGGRIDLGASQVHFNTVRAKAKWGPGWLKPEHNKIRIITTESGTLDIEAQSPFKRGKPNRIKGKTTLKKQNFVTHEPFTRPAGGREKDDIA